MLDPKVATMVSRDLEGENIVVFDEAHNIDNVCIEALSVTLDKRSLDVAIRSVGRLQARVAEMKSQDSERLMQEYRDLVRGLALQGVRALGSGVGNMNDVGSSSNSNGTEITMNSRHEDAAADVSAASLRNATTTITSAAAASTAVSSFSVTRGPLPDADVLQSSPLLPSDILEEVLSHLSKRYKVVWACG
jgi:Rad3-related DNA helicase